VNEFQSQSTVSVSKSTTVHRECNLSALQLTSAVSNVVQVIAGSGVQVVHTFTLVNNGPSECDGVRILVDDNVNSVPGVTSVNGTGNINVTTNIGSEVQQTFTIVYTVTSSAPAGAVITTSADIADSGDRKRAPVTGPALSVSTTVVRVVNLSITKTADHDLVATGSTITYTVTVTNNGPSDTNGLEVVDNCVTATGAVETGCVNNAALPFPATLTASSSASRTLTITSSTSGFGVISNVAIATGINSANETTNTATSATIQSNVAPLEPKLVFSAFRSRNGFDESDEDDDDSDRCTERDHSEERCTRLFFVELANGDANVRADSVVIALTVTNVASSEALLTQSSRDDVLVNNGRGSFTWTVPTLQPGARSRVALKVRVTGATQQISAHVEMANACLPETTAADCENFAVASISGTLSAPYTFSKRF